MLGGGGVRVPSVAATKNDIGKPSCTEGTPRKVDVKPEPDTEKKEGWLWSFPLH